MKAIGCNPTGVISKTGIGGYAGYPEVSRVRGDSKLGTRGLWLSSDDSLCKFFKKLRFNLSFYFLLILWNIIFFLYYIFRLIIF